MIRRSGSGIVLAALILGGCNGSSTDVSTTTITSAEITTTEAPTTTVVVTVPSVVQTTLPPLHFVLTDDATLRAALNRAAQHEIGRYANEQEHAAFASYFHGIEREQQTNQQRGRSYYTPDPNAQAVSWIDKNDSEEVSAHRMAQQGQAMDDIISGRSTTTTTCDPRWSYCP